MSINDNIGVVLLKKFQEAGFDIKDIRKSRRFQLALQYLAENSEEQKHINEYRIKLTSDKYFFKRIISHNGAYFKRIGMQIGAVAVAKSKTANKPIYHSVVIFREVPIKWVFEDGTAFS